MRALSSLILLLSLLSLPAWAGPNGRGGGGGGGRGGQGGGGGGMVGMVAKAHQNGQWRLVLQQTAPILEKDPDNADAFAKIGTAFANAGLYADALQAFRFSLGAPILEREGIAAYADTLRAFGRVEEAERLRRERLYGVKNIDDQVPILLAIAEDRRAGGDAWGAVDAAWEALSILPNSPTAHADLVRFSIEAGDLDSAGYHAWMCGRWEPIVLRCRVGQAWLALAEGVPEDALALARGVKVVNKAEPELLEVEARALLALGEPQDAVAALDRARARERRQPVLERLRGQAELESGEVAAAVARLSVLAAEYPNDTEAAALLTKAKAAVAAPAP